MSSQKHTTLQGIEARKEQGRDESDVRASEVS